MTRVVVLSGNPRTPSRTSAVAHQVAGGVATVLADRVGADGVGPDGVAIVSIELADIAGEVLVGGPGLAAAREQVLAADLLVVATPAYKGAYTGLLKGFLDTFGAGELAGVPAIPLVIAGQDAHLPAGEVHLRPVLLEVGAAVPAPALALAQRVVDSPEQRVEAIATWVERHGGVLAAAVAAAAAGRAAAADAHPDHTPPADAHPASAHPIGAPA